jgi:DinB superfamily
MPDAYRQSLLAALGDDDPADVLALGPDTFRALLDEAGALLHIRPEPGEWSVGECLAHLADGEVILSGRYRWILAEDEPDIVGYDQALWVSELDQNTEDPASLLAVFTALRRWNLELWSRRPEEDRERFGIHRERGPESYGLTFRLGAGHDRVHFEQARRTLEAVRTATSSG